jgi:RNA polymerase sigma factor (sigma-70 family)
VADSPKIPRLSARFTEWHTPLRKFLSSNRSVRPPDIDDVAQEVFLRLLRYDRAELVEHPQAYLYKMATNVAAEWAIRLRNSRPHEPKWLDTLTSTELPDAVTMRSQVQGEIARALETLNARQRETLRLLFEEGLSHAEIAVRTAQTLRSVKRIITKSYERLRCELDEELLGVLADENI